MNCFQIRLKIQSSARDYVKPGDCILRISPANDAKVIIAVPLESKLRWLPSSYSIKLSPELSLAIPDTILLKTHAARILMDPSGVDDSDSKAEAVATAESNRGSGNGSTPTRSPAGKTKRKTKRLLWTEELHLRFVSAVFELGVKNASPKALLALMESKHPTEGLTTDHIKSHLQKYRISYERSKLEAHRLNEKHGKRSLKRHHRHQQHRETEDKSSGNASVASTSDHIVVQDTNQQWDMCDALLLEDEASEQHMHSTMQQRMDFHRELLLTRSVEVQSGLSWANRMSSINTTNKVAANDYYNDRHESSFLQAWANAEQLRQQQEQVYGRLHEQQQSLFHQAQEAAPVAPVSVGGSMPEPPPRSTDEIMDTDGGVDLTSWGRLSLTVDSDDDDVFGFLRS
ncbi:Two-component response regulator ARR18 [Phytophthora nicotianae]|uniref:Two-component response regulator ARR18 n=2 Tax=Phytophthora nicotianae TaxID=4792 RepID=A0A0W8CCM8_PHYNI|nr:Two-component response regulator ARR18 [Phytophthora nicotianae]